MKKKGGAAISFHVRGRKSNRLGTHEENLAKGRALREGTSVQRWNGVQRYPVLPERRERDGYVPLFAC